MFTPQNIKKLTNVSVVTLKRYGMTFELALYPNKMHDYKHKLTTDIDQILHTPEIFKNVSKGLLANRNDLEKCFPEMNKNEIIRFILDHGAEKMSEKTRLHEFHKKEKEIISFVQRKIVDSDNKSLSEGIIKNLMCEKKINIDLRKESKVQANNIINIILKQENYKRVSMFFSIHPKDSKIILDEGFTVEDHGLESIVEIECDQFRKFKDFCEGRKIQYSLVERKEENSEEIC